MTAAERVEATRYVCGDPKCETAHVVADGEVGSGYTMTVVVPDASRSTAGRTVGREVDVYACQITHVRGAVEAATAPIRRPDGGKPGKPVSSSDSSDEDGPGATEGVESGELDDEAGEQAERAALGPVGNGARV